MQPKVSVIIPAYNSALFIAATIRSVLDQTYGNYEVIIVDDGSTDDTLQVLNTFVPSSCDFVEKPIRVFSKSNGGPASARNLAIRNSTGKYIAFLDGDDLWTPDKLAEQVAFLEQHSEVGMTFAEAIVFTERNGQKEFREKIGYTGETSFCHLLLGDHIPNSTVMIRRECVDKIGLLNESSELVAVEDYEYWLRLARSFPIKGIAKPMAYYRVHANNLMGDGEDIERGLRLPLLALKETERLFPDCWQQCGVEREVLLARLHIRAGFAWKQRGEWGNCLKKFSEALKLRCNLRVIRWIVAATLLKRWS
ncbi:MAG: glycosyltransferase [Acidobacteria bacterium]|nr:glycosyltransferase [Acidobacteriota bacterium]